MARHTAFPAPRTDTRPSTAGTRNKHQRFALIRVVAPAQYNHVSTPLEHVDGLLPDDLTVFTTILTRHGREATLRSDIDTLVDARFTAERLTAYDTHYGPSPDFNPRSLIRLHEDKVTPELAGAALKRGHLTANDVIADVTAYRAKGQRHAEHLDDAYQAGLTIDHLDLAPDELRDLLTLHNQIGGDINALLVIRKALPDGPRTSSDIVSVLTAATSGPHPLSLVEIADAIAPHATFFARHYVRPLRAALDPHTTQARMTHHVTFPHTISLLVAAGGQFVSAEAVAHLVQVAGKLPEETDLGALVELSLVTQGATHHVSLLQGRRAPRWIGGPDVPYPALDEAARRYQTLNYLTPRQRISALPLIGTPGAASALEAFLREGGGPHLHYTMEDLVPAAAALRDLTPDEANECATYAARTLNGLDPAIYRNGPFSNNGGIEQLLSSLAAHAAEVGPHTAATELLNLAAHLPLAPERALYALTGSQREGIPVPRVLEFLQQCPQVAPDVVATLVAHDINPRIYQALLRALPFEAATTHIALYEAVMASGVPHHDAITRIDQAIAGNPLPDAASLIAAVHGSPHLLTGAWDAYDSTLAFLEADPELHKLRPPSWSSHLNKKHSLGWENPGALPDPGLGVPPWTPRRVASEPWTLTGANPWHHTAARVVNQWRHALFPSHGAPQLDRARAYTLESSGREYRTAINSTIADPTTPSTIDDPRWYPLRAALLTRELEAANPDLDLILDLIRTDVSDQYSRRTLKSVDEAQLLAALTLHYPELGGPLAMLLVEHSRSIAELLNEGPVQIGVIQAGAGQAGHDSFLYDPSYNPPFLETTLDAHYVHTFAQHHPGAGPTRMLVNYLNGVPPGEMMRDVHDLHKSRESLMNFLRFSVLRGANRQHTLMSLNRRDLSITGLPTPPPLDKRGRGQLPPLPANAEVLVVLTPTGVHPTQLETPIEHTTTRVAEHPQDSIAAYCARIGKVVDWYAGILVDPLQAGWTAENAPAIIDRRSTIFANLETLLVQLQDHPLMRGTVDPGALGDLGQQAAPADFTTLTRALESTMHQAWEEATQAGSAYTTREVDDNPHQKLDELHARHAAVQLRAEALGLLTTAQALRLETPDTPEGAAKHAKAHELEQRAQALDVEAAHKEQHAATIAHGTDDIIRLVQALSVNPLLAGTAQLAELPHLKTLSTRNVAQLETAGPRVPRIPPRPGGSAPSITPETQRRHPTAKDPHARILS